MAVSISSLPPADRAGNDRRNMRGTTELAGVATHFDQEVMESTQSLTITERALLEEGFADLSDSRVGEYVDTFEQKDFPFLTEDGLDFLKKHVLSNATVKSTVKSFFENKRCVLAHCLRYGALPGHIESFIGGRDAGQSVLAVYLLAKGSGVDFYAKSHLHMFPAEKGPRRTRELSRSTLREADCKVQRKEFDIGGLMILDGRLGREIWRGYAIIAMFMTEDLLSRFNIPPMVLPNSPRLEDKVKEMQDEVKPIRLNFAFKSIANIDT